MWQAKYRNYVPWSFIAGCYLVCGVIPLVIRWILVRENTLRDKEEYDPTYDDICIKRTTPEDKKVDMGVPNVRSASRFWCPI